MKVSYFGWVIVGLVVQTIAVEKMDLVGTRSLTGTGPTTNNTCGSGSTDESCQCDAGQRRITTDGGATFACNPCEPGTYLGFNSHTLSKCFLCSPGTAAGKLGSIRCNWCSPGSEAPEEGSTSCSLCKPGSFAERSGSQQCAKCHPGSGTGYDEFGSTTCAECPPGTFSSGRDGICEKCNAGTYQPFEGSTGCVVCSPGYFQPLNGSTSCTRCPPGSVQPQVGSESCNSCPVGSFTSDGGISCIKCGIFEYNLYESSSGCSPCLVPTTLFGLKHLDQCQGTWFMIVMFLLSCFYYCFRRYHYGRSTTNTSMTHDARSSDDTDKSLLTTI